MTCLVSRGRAPLALDKSAAVRCGEGEMGRSHEAVETLYHQLGPALLAYARSLLRDRALAEDAVHQVFLNLMAGRATLPDEPRPYLFRAVRNTSLNSLRAGSREAAVARAEPIFIARDGLEALVPDLESALAELREFARGVHPSILREDGLDAALETLARRASMPVDVSGSVGERLPDAVELATYFFVSEALTNVAKHARASRVDVTVDVRGDVLRVSVADDGVGGAEADIASGLAGLADRLAALDGRLEIESAPDLGTTLTATIPCAS
jgi:DNA-directed RNA polymerase specialized sigma24 family protein